MPALHGRLRTRWCCGDVGSFVDLVSLKLMTQARFATTEPNGRPSLARSSWLQPTPTLPRSARTSLDCMRDRSNSTSEMSTVRHRNNERLSSTPVLPVRLHIARDGEQALAMLRDERFRPAMIILDLSLPKVSGFEVLEQNPRKDIPVVIFSASQLLSDSASQRLSDKERTLALGAKEYVHKPMDMVGYRNAVLGMVRNWAMSEQDTNGAVPM
jgi:CheY-like chemotaxis protein